MRRAQKAAEGDKWGLLKGAGGEGGGHRGAPRCCSGALRKGKGLGTPSLAGRGVFCGGGGWGVLATSPKLAWGLGVSLCTPW